MRAVPSATNPAAVVSVVNRHGQKTAETAATIRSTRSVSWRCAASCSTCTASSMHMTKISVGSAIVTMFRSRPAAP